MKCIVVLTMALFAGCGSYVPLKQLEAEALVTGDWSLVERREAAIARRDVRNSVNCPPGYIDQCAVFGSDRRCTCVERSEIFSLIDN